MLEDSGYSAASFATADHDHAAVYQPLDADLTSIAGIAIARGMIITGQGVAPVWTGLAAGVQYKVLTMGANEPAWSGFLLDGTAGGKVSFAVTNAKTLTLTAADTYNLTIPATGTAALLGTANVFTTLQTITPATDVVGLIINKSATADAFQIKTGVTVLAAINGLGFIGVGGAAYTTYGVTVTKSVDAAAAQLWAGLRLFWTDASTASNTHYVVGANFGVTSSIGAGITNSGYLHGIDMAATHAGAGTIAAVMGAFFQGGTYNAGADSTGTVTDLYGGYFDIIKTASSTLTNVYGISIGWDVAAATKSIAINIATSSAVTQYKRGILIGNLSGGSVSTYAIYTGTGLVHFGDSLDLASGKNITLVAANIITDTTTGTKIGTATAQKLGFWNKTPIIQPAGATQVAPAAYATGAFGLDSDAHMQALYDLVVAMRTALVNSGLMKGAA